MPRPPQPTVTIGLNLRNLRRLWASCAVSHALGEPNASPTTLLKIAINWEETRLRKLCAERGLSYDALAREFIPHLGPVKRGTKLRDILGVTDAPLPPVPKSQPSAWAGNEAGPEFAPDVDDIDPRAFDSE